MTARPNDIPKDIWDKAVHALGADGGLKHLEFLADPVARLILAERERGERACDRYLIGSPSNETAITARGIRDLIRNGHADAQGRDAA